MGIIRLEDIEIYAYHGCYEEEQIAGNWFTVNLTLETPMEVSSSSDRIEDALNYQHVYEIVKAEMAVKSHLLEHVSGRILNALFTRFEKLEKATVKVAKVNPPMGGKMRCVSVEQSRVKS